MVKAIVYSSRKIIPTYELLEDDLNPILDKHLNPYPYTMQNYRDKEIVDKVYDVVVLENEYLEITVLPTLGGRIYSAVDKRRNQDFLYRNKVIKPRMIGTRGAWFSGGMEFNFPISHSPTSMSRVNCTYSEHKDGSASIIFGHIEQLSYMSWKVELKLYPGKAYMEQNVSLVNPTSRENRFYFWTNTAVEYDRSVKLVYPFNWCINHLDTSYLRWPMYRDVDCRQAGEIPFAYETFGKLLEHGYFGSYHENKDYGVVHVANPKKVKGAKFFSWGNDGNAEAWNRSLTDDDSQYIEIQSGPFETQMVYKFLKPHQSMSWTEYWYPISGTGGFDYAVKEVAVRVTESENQLKLCFAATEPLGPCLAVLSYEGLEVEQWVDLSPDQLGIISFNLSEKSKLSSGTDGRFAYNLKLFCGRRLLLSMDSGVPDEDSYPDKIRFEDSRIVRNLEEENELLNGAIFKESLGLTGEAISLYKMNLVPNPNCQTTLVRLGALYVQTMQAELAMRYLECALSFQNRNDEARFHLACAYKQLGDLTQARRMMLDIASASHMYHASVIELAKLDIKLGRVWEAHGLLESHDRKSSVTQCLLSISNRLLDDHEAARKAIDSLILIDEWAMAEKYLLSLLDEDKISLLSFTKGDEQVLVPIALVYFDMGMYGDAGRLLNLVAYRTLKSELVQLAIDMIHNNCDSDQIVDVIRKTLDHVFVNEPTLIQFLERLQKQDQFGTTNYLLGIYYYSVARVEDAITSLLAAYDKGLRNTSLLYTIGYILNKHHADTEQSEIYLLEDLALNPHMNEKSLVLLDTIYASCGEHEKRARTAELMMSADNKSLVLLSLVDALHHLGRLDEALYILDNEEFENWEGREDSGPCYRQVVLAAAHKALEEGNLVLTEQWLQLALQYPASLNYGDSIRTPFADVHYYHGLLARALENHELAEIHFLQGAEELENKDLLHTKSSIDYAERCKQELGNN